MNNGKLKSVIIEDRYNTDERTGIRSLSEWVYVWADKGLVELFRKIEGIASATSMSETSYLIHIDPRYDRQYITAEIEAVAKIADE